jgi:hypothetical protein
MPDDLIFKAPVVSFAAPPSIVSKMNFGLHM